MKILFLCVANSARSQMAEGIARKVFGENANVKSAGSLPGKLHPWAVKVCSEIGIDISTHYSKGIGDLPKEFLDGLEYVITLCAEESCPVLPTKAKRLSWAIPDPAGTLADDLQRVRFLSARQTIRFKILDFAKEQGWRWSFSKFVSLGERGTKEKRADLEFI